MATADDCSVYSDGRGWAPLLGVALALAVAGGCGDPTAEVIERARQQLAEGNLTAAEKLFDEALAIDPQSVEALLGRGEVRMSTERYALAEEDFTSAWTQAPTNYLARLKRGQSRRLAGNGPGAVEDFEALIAERSLADDWSILAQAYLGRGETWIEKDQLDKALADLRKSAALARQAKPPLPRVACEALLHQGKVELAQGQLADAVKSLSEAIDHQPEEAYAWWLRAAAHDAIGDAVAARRDRRRAVALEPSFQLAESPAGAAVLNDIRVRGASTIGGGSSSNPRP